MVDLVSHFENRNQKNPKKLDDFFRMATPDTVMVRPCVGFATRGSLHWRKG